MRVNSRHTQKPRKNTQLNVIVNSANSLPSGPFRKQQRNVREVREKTKQTHRGHLRTGVLLRTVVLQ